MPSSAGVQHIDLVVSSIERSLPFYRELLAPPGYPRTSEIEGDRGETIWSLSGPGVAIGLREAQSDKAQSDSASKAPHDRYSVGIHHLAFEAWSRAMVDERAEWLVARGAEIESGPEQYAYQPGYYAVFFDDPDGIKLEIVHIPDQAA